MPNDTLTLALSGEVSLDDFAQAVHALESLLSAIQQQNPDIAKVRWVIDDLRVGSATARIRGIGKGAETMVDDYQKIGDNLAEGRMPSSEPIRRAIEELTGIIGQSVKSIRFETQDRDAEVFAPATSNTIDIPIMRLASNVYGSVRGRIQSISNRKKLEFTLYDVNTDSAISCYLEAGAENAMRKAWGRLATVSGIVRRNPITGDPTTVRHIKAQDIKLIPEISGSWRDAIGASRSRKGEESAEVAIRRMRDG